LKRLRVSNSAAPQLKNIPWWGKNILRAGKRTFGRGAKQKYTKYNIINNNSENFRGKGKISARGSFPPASLSCGSGTLMLKLKARSTLGVHSPT